MKPERLHELEEISEAIHNTIAEIKYQYESVDLGALENEIASLDAVLTSWAIALDEPDEPVM